MPGEGTRPRLHYAWVIAGTGTLCILACLGLGRFALGMLLPSMGASLGLSYAELGYVSTGNFVGYLSAVLLCGPVAARTGARALIAGALLLVSASMLLVSRAGSFAPLLLLYALTGLGSGAVNVPVMGLIARWFAGRSRGRAAGFAAIGSGFGIMATGALVPAVNRARGPEGWRTSWLLLGLAVALVALVAGLLLRNTPGEKGTRPHGEEGGAGAAHPSAGAGGGGGAPGAGSARPLVLLGLAYALFGYTYAIYVTFIVTSLVRERGVSEAAAGTFWSWVGLLSLLSGPVFGTLSDRAGRRAGLMVVFALQAIAYALAAWGGPPGLVWLSVGLFGIAAWSIPTIMIAAVTDWVGPEKALARFGLITFVFGLGQIAGPSVAGLLAQRSGGFSSSFAMAAAVSAGAVLVSSLLPRGRRHLPPAPVPPVPDPEPRR